MEPVVSFLHELPDRMLILDLLPRFGILALTPSMPSHFLLGDTRCGGQPFGEEDGSCDVRIQDGDVGYEHANEEYHSYGTCKAPMLGLLRHLSLIGV